MDSSEKGGFAINVTVFSLLLTNWLDGARRSNRKLFPVDLFADRKPKWKVSNNGTQNLHVLTFLALFAFLHRIIYIVESFKRTFTSMSMQK